MSAPVLIAPIEQVDQAVNGLRRAAPEMSADHAFSRRQLMVLLLLLMLAVLSGVFFPIATGVALVGLCTVLYISSLGYRLLLVRRGLSGEHLIRVSAEDARSVAHEDLPVFTVLVPAYREPEVIAKIVDALGALEYPADRLDVKLMLEEDDEETLAAVIRTGLPAGVQVIRVPAMEPRTKPKACNVGLAMARGEYITIFDAEDKPEPLQLRRAVVALRRLGRDVACLQARLGFFNQSQNMMTRWFTIEYGSWFRFLLPGLVASRATIPLGGTSNHFRTDTLRAVGGWDPFNVTEDADLGVRLARLGYRVGVLDSETAEEANSDVVNWIKQRSRWYKGYLQTWLVHMRAPVRLHRELGGTQAIGFHLFVLGTPLLALINPIFWVLALLWVVDQPAWVAALFPPGLFYVAFASFLIGNAAVLYTNLLTVRMLDRRGLLLAALLMPAYWFLMSAAAVKAGFQLLFQPSYWEKTTHGLSEPHHGESLLAAERVA